MFDTSRGRITIKSPGWYLVPVLTLLVVVAACGQESTNDASSGQSSTIAEPSEDSVLMTETESTSPDTGSNAEADDDTVDDPPASSSSTTGSTGSTAAPGTTASTSGQTTSTSDETSSTDSTSTSSEPTDPGAEVADDVDYDQGLKPLVDQARADLAGRLGIAADQIALALAELRTWPDSANGCPQDGMQYLQVLTDGSEMIFSAQGATYRYTTGGQVYIPQLCEK
jgi:hypothetical protein